MNNTTLYLRHAELLRDLVPSFQTYPFHLPAVRTLDRLTFQKPVTFLVGENGTGKSTLLEGIAAAWGFNPEGGTLNFSFNTRSSHSSLYEYFRIARGVRRPKDGFFYVRRVTIMWLLILMSWMNNPVAHRSKTPTEANLCMSSPTESLFSYVRSPFRRPRSLYPRRA